MCHKKPLRPSCPTKVKKLTERFGPGAEETKRHAATKPNLPIKAFW